MGKMRFLNVKSVSLLLALLLLGLLIPAAALAQSGDIQITSEPRVRIFIDDEFMGVTNETDNGLFVEGLSPGPHILEAIKSGHPPFVQEVSVPDGSVMEVKLDFRGPEQKEPRPAPLAQPPRTDVATFILSSEPLGAKVYINGQYKGDADIVVENVSAGRHRILFQQGKRRVSGTYSLRPGETMKLRASFKRQEILDITEQKKTLPTARDRSNVPAVQRFE